MGLNKTTFILMLTLLPLFAAGCDPGSHRNNGNDTRTKIINATHYRSIIDTFDSFSYTWEKLENGVPPLRINEFPTDIHMIRPTSKKKDFFFQLILPLALMGNKEIQQHKNAVDNYFKYIDQGKQLSLHQHEELLKIQRYYKIEGDILHNSATRNRLLKRIDIIPPALILAQAANESGWGISRFAQQANNIFGEWTFTPGTGLVPKGRPKGETYEVRRFDTLYDSIRSYLRNLNTHRAYRTMRTARLRLRNSNLPLTGYALAGEMQFYSTRREAYVRELRDIIISNRLENLNSVALLNEAVPRPPESTPRKKGLIGSQENAQNRLKS